MVQRSSQGPLKYTLRDQHTCTYPIQGFIYKVGYNPVEVRTQRQSLQSNSDEHYIPTCSELYRSLNGPLCGSLSVYLSGYLLPCSVSLYTQYTSHKHTNYEPTTKHLCCVFTVTYAIKHHVILSTDTVHNEFLTIRVTVRDLQCIILLVRLFHSTFCESTCTCLVQNLEYLNTQVKCTVSLTVYRNVVGIKVTVAHTAVSVYICILQNFSFKS